MKCQVQIAACAIAREGDAVRGDVECVKEVVVCCDGVLEGGWEATFWNNGEAVIGCEDVGDAGVLEDRLCEGSRICVATVADNVCASVEMPVARSTSAC